MAKNFEKKLINFPEPIVESINKYKEANSITYFSTAVMELIRIGLDEVDRNKNLNFKTRSEDKNENRRK